MHLLPIAYPLRAAPIFRDYLWGGRKLASRLGKALPDEGVWAESWELIDHPEFQSVVINGPLAGKSLHEIASADPRWLIGDPPGLDRLPLLFKYLDCQRVLSVQVHPDDTYAQAMPVPDLGKTEAWYIIDSEPDSVLYAGLKSGVSAASLRAAMQANQIEECLHKISPQPGECIFIPAGTVHALGAGLLVAEIQQASNTTFRLFDWNRVDADGQSRTLHIDQALEVIDFESGPRQFQTPQPTEQVGRERLVSCDKFNFDRLTGSNSIPVAGDGTFHVLSAPRGGATLMSASNEPVSLAVGETVLIPAASASLEAEISEGAILLDMYLPR